ncbi:hypothetical protein [Azospirillum sp. SYSU D00513]|uniref:hypothetical protein n=1 Tax=Azospirillum sp. SYSU D00513 TaxID=2812561 RepID=UPI001A97A84C|nr:hypothetical protein [Azospirillum sp. SYSU D00513]
MTIRHTIAAAALSAAALLSGTALAGDFASDLREATILGQTANRDVREAVAPALKAARSLEAFGDTAQARDFLAYARGQLGLSNGSALVATPVVAGPAVGAASFDAQLTEAMDALSGAGRDVREAAAPSLKAAQAFSTQGKQAQARDHLNFARGKLGLAIPAESRTAKVDLNQVAELRDEAH